MLSIVLTLVLALRVAPSLIGDYLAIELAFNIYHMCNLLIILLFSWCAYISTPWKGSWKNSYIKGFAMLILVVNGWFLINYVYLNAEKAAPMVELVDG